MRLTAKEIAFAGGKISASYEVTIGLTSAVLGVAGRSRIVGGDLAAGAEISKRR